MTKKKRKTDKVFRLDDDIAVILHLTLTVMGFALYKFCKDCLGVFAWFGLGFLLEVIGY